MTAASLVIAPSLILLLAIIGGLWKFASFRGDIFEKWSSRTELAKAGLSVKAVEELRQIQRQIAELMGAEGQFDPTKVIAEPADLLSSVLYFKQLIDAREGTNRWLSYLLRLDKILITSLISLAIGVGLTALCLLGSLAVWYWFAIAVFLDVTSLLILGGCWIAYFIAMRRLSQAETLSTMERSTV